MPVKRGHKKKAPSKPGPKRIVYRKRNRGQAGPRKRQQKNFKDTEGNCLQVTKAVGNKRVGHGLQQVWKVLNANKKKSIYAFAFVNRMGVPANAGEPPGSVNVGSNWNGATIGTGDGALPLHLISLSQVPNYNGTSLVNPAAYNVLFRAGSSGGMFFTGLSGTYTPVDTPASSTTYGAFPNSCDILSGVSIKMLLHGCLNRSTKFRIDLVQLLEPYLHPDYQKGDFSGPPTAEASATIAFYDELTREYTYSGATFCNGNATKGKIRYLKSWTHTFQPRSTTEAMVTTDDATVPSQLALPHCRQFNIYQRFNRTQRYDWQESAATAEPTSNTTDNPSITTGLNRPDVTYRARIYLMIRALSPIPTVNGKWKIGVHPSMDISVRTYHESI